ncbi:deaminated glutathione amidase-like isoform X1 [Periplaneta americana]|uniref:deaminated glutathione amidase-like isoform X1 n=2 Tax=Periplaneta americana TaxID=6978 RepID=UPI0037E84406
MYYKVFNTTCRLHSTLSVFLQRSTIKKSVIKNSTRTMASVQSKKIIAVCQMTAKDDKQSNINTCSELVKSAKALNAEMAFLPESCDFIGETRSQFVENAEDINGETMQSFRQMAKDNNIWLSLGGILEKVDGQKVRNAHVVINNSGDIVSVYRKIHLFDVDIPEKKLRIMESDYVLPGDKIVEPVDTPVGKVGLAICYDMRFPELSLTLTRMGADILTYPSAFTFATGAVHWETLLRARAIENQCYVVAAAQTGSHNQKRSSWGHAMVVDPWGTVVAQCSEGTNIAIAQIDLSYIKQVRSTMPVWQHRRNDLYAEMTPLKTVEKSSEIEDKTVYKFGQTSVPGSAVFYKTNRTLAFTNKRCVVPGHVLVMPIRCVQTLQELETDEMEDLLLVLNRVKTVVETVNGVSSTTTGIQTGADAGQTVKHLHVHILPRKSTQPDKSCETAKMDADYKPERTAAEMAAEAAMLRSYFQ